MKSNIWAQLQQNFDVAKLFNPEKAQFHPTGYVVL